MGLPTSKYLTKKKKITHRYTQVLGFLSISDVVKLKSKKNHTDQPFERRVRILAIMDSWYYFVTLWFLWEASSAQIAEFPLCMCVVYNLNSCKVA